MTILYAVQAEEFINLKNLTKLERAKFDKIYINITNRCPCSCSFCIRNDNEQYSNLWLEREPTIEVILDEFKNININKCEEFVFCGYGEALERIEIVIEICKYLKKKNPNVRIRVNTNGLGNLIHNRDIVPSLKGLVDSMSISLNAATKDRYLEITNSKFGSKSFQAMLEFTNNCKKYISDITLSVVDVIDREEVDKCEELCAKLGVKFKLRTKI